MRDEARDVLRADPAVASDRDALDELYRLEIETTPDISVARTPEERAAAKAAAVRRAEAAKRPEQGGARRMVICAVPHGVSDRQRRHATR